MNSILHPSLYWRHIPDPFFRVHFFFNVINFEAHNDYWRIGSYQGLNAILDHRAEVFIPELGCTFKCPSSFRIFACQNPSHQGGGRKGLPKSFLNRFTKVFVSEFTCVNLMLILFNI